MGRKTPATDEDLISEIAGHNERAPARWRAQAELNRRIAERAGASTHKWTVIATWAAIIAAIASIVALFK